MTVCTSESDSSDLFMIVLLLKSYSEIIMQLFKVDDCACSNIIFIKLDDVKISVDNLIDEKSQSMKYIITNFNHEHLTIFVTAAYQTHVALSSVFKYCLEQKAFDKTLMNQFVM